MTTAYEFNVFVNCPFDEGYAPLFDAIVFTVHDCGFVARCALEVSNSAQVRIDKIFEMIAECRYGIHDISRTELDAASGLPRFNMPLELGLFLGARRYGRGRQREKACLVLDREPYRYQKFCSDIAGQDIKAHSGDVRRAVGVVRDWLRSAPAVQEVRVPGGAKIFERYEAFLGDLPRLCEALDLDRQTLIFNDYATLLVEWQRVHA